MGFFNFGAHKLCIKKNIKKQCLGRLVLDEYFFN
jgi:hypothetical protein